MAPSRSRRSPWAASSTAWSRSTPTIRRSIPPSSGTTPSRLPMPTGWSNSSVVATPGRAAWVAAVGSVPVAALTVTKLSWLHRTNPDAWARITHLVLPHDYVTFRMTGRFTTDRGDASGTGYWSPATGDYVDEVLALIDRDRDWSGILPTVVGPYEQVGTYRAGCRRSGHRRQHGRGARSRPAHRSRRPVGGDIGDRLRRVGRGGVRSERRGRRIRRRHRAVPAARLHLNAAKVIDAVARLLGVDHDEFDRLALAANGASRPRCCRTSTVSGLPTDRPPRRDQRAAHRRLTRGLGPGGGRGRGLRARRRARLAARPRRRRWSHRVGGRIGPQRRLPPGPRRADRRADRGERGGPGGRHGGRRPGGRGARTGRCRHDPGALGPRWGDSDRGRTRSRRSARSIRRAPRLLR